MSQRFNEEDLPKSYRGVIVELSRSSRSFRRCIEELSRLFEAWCRFHQCVRCYRLTPKDRRLPRMNRGVIDEDLWTSYRRCIEGFEDLSRICREDLSRSYRGCIEDVSKMTRRCLEDVSKMSRRCLEYLLRINRRFSEDLLHEAIRALMEVSSMCPMAKNRRLSKLIRGFKDVFGAIDVLSRSHQCFWGFKHRFMEDLRGLARICEVFNDFSSAIFWS